MMQRPLNNVRQHFRRIAGDLSQPVESDAAGRNCVGKLFPLLSEMQDSLRDAVSSIREGSDTLRDSASEIARGNTDLSRVPSSRRRRWKRQRRVWKRSPRQ